MGNLLDYLRAHPEVQVAGVFSHLAKPEAPADPLTQRQLRIFQEVTQTFKARYPAVIASLLSTAGILHLGEKAAYDAVRVGIGLYGAMEGLTEATALYAPILRMWEVTEETRINYGFSAQVEPGMRVATVAIGYGDGLLRAWAASPQARVYLRGRPLRVFPPLNMDLMLVALPADLPATEGDLVWKSGDRPSPYASLPSYARPSHTRCWYASQSVSAAFTSGAPETRSTPPQHYLYRTGVKMPIPWLLSSFYDER